ncbi:MAG: proline racemase family protein [Marinifilaceae bacterium]|nr:proline racemase family protein [Marinifilaceae bacterium]
MITEILTKWKAPTSWLKLKSFEMHTGGEPLRVFTHGLPEIKGNTILEKRKYFSEKYDFIRKATMWEPRGHADMYGAIITDPCREDSDFGTFFLHNEGYSTMCGHAMIALVTLVLDTGMIYKDEENPIVKIDAPPGQIICKAYRHNGKVIKVSFRNVPSFVFLKNQIVDVEGLGNICFDIAYGGAFYAYVNIDQLNLSLNSQDYNKLIDYGRRIKLAVMNDFEIKHPVEEDLSFLYGTIFTGMSVNPNNHSRNVCVFADGELDRSPTGSGVSGRAAIHYSRDEIGFNQEIEIESILGSTMTVKVVDELNYYDYHAVIPEVSGSAFITGENIQYFDPDDKIGEGFIFR